jgi:hypothetical protein
MFIFILLSAPMLGLLYTLSKLNYKKTVYAEDMPRNLVVSHEYNTNNVNLKNGALQTSIFAL